MGLDTIVGYAPAPSMRACREQSSVVVKLCSVMLLALTVANCASSDLANRRGGDNKYGVAASPRVIAEGEPIPKGGGRDMIGRPYVVGGRTYVPMKGHGYHREGWASWYGTAFHGRLTANGEIFDRQSVAAASPTLPLPSYVRVTNVLNKRSMIVRVNDRGPYEGSRLIDVSERVAEALDFRRKGTARVRVEYVGKASTNGSDDEKLLATLRTDGSAAPFGRAGGAIMMADLRADPMPRSLAFKTEVAAPSIIESADEAMEAPTAVDTPVQVAAAVSGETPSSVGAGDMSATADETAFEAAPIPPPRPVEFGGTSVAALEAPKPMQNLAVSDLLPPRRPVLAGIY